MRRSQVLPNRQYTAKVGDTKIKGSAEQIAAKCEALGYAARREKDEVLAHSFWQTAEYYRKVAAGEP